MKNILLAIALISIVSCTKSGDGSQPGQPAGKATIRFYSTNAVTGTKVITVKVSGTDCGRLNYSASQPACGAAGFATIMLDPGTYKADYIDASNPYANKQVSFTVPQSVTSCVFYDLK